MGENCRDKSGLLPRTVDYTLNLADNFIVICRLVKPLKSRSFFVFGARGTGKSTLVRGFLKESAHVLDLLDDDVYEPLVLRPKRLEDICAAVKKEWILIDEVQRIPELLNHVHRLIENKGQKFALTGSSSRKLKRGSANLLAGRALVNHLFPFTSLELGKNFDLNTILQWGSLPEIFKFTQSEERKAYLKSYCRTYIKEEIQVEQIVRKLEPFREFLTVAALSSGKIINYSSIAREVGCQVPTVQTYFQILEETYLGFYLPHYHRSIRKSQLVAPKFYLFDNGVKKALETSLDNGPVPGTSAYGDLFEAWIIQEIYRLNEYYGKDYRLSYWATKNSSEIDLVLSKLKKVILIEIKSTVRVDPIEVRRLSELRKAFGTDAQAFYLSQDLDAQQFGDVTCLHWLDFLQKFSSY